MSEMLRGQLEANADMRRYTSWRAGGRAERLYTPADLEDVCAFLKTLAAGEPIHVIGLGSNLLVRDGGLPGTVIHLHGALKHLRIEERCQEHRGEEAGVAGTSPQGVVVPEGGAREAAAEHVGLRDKAAYPSYGVVYAEAGVASPKVARFAANHNLAGAEFLAGIPGTVGGALAMNAGCYGFETWAYVCQLLTVDAQGLTHKRSPREFRVGYRHVEPSARRNEWFLAAWFMFPRGDGQAGRAEIKRLLERRIASQPLDQPNAGSVFRNPPGDFAARLIESCGMKGLRIGDAQVSEKHANFIVNLGAASATDIETLIETVQARVKAETGVELQREVRIIGEPAAPACNRLVEGSSPGMPALQGGPA